jgi:hypothetical protein
MAEGLRWRISLSERVPQEGQGGEFMNWLLRETRQSVQQSRE